MPTKLQQFHKRIAQNDPKQVETQHKKGKLTARERIEILFDRDSFIELGSMVQLRSHDFDLQNKKTDGDGVITGHGTINGRKVFAYAQDFSVMGGSLGEMHAQKIIKIQDMALSSGSPLVAIIDSGGARIQEGLHSLDGYAGIFSRHVEASGVIPQIAIMAGPSAGGASYAPALMDFVFMVKDISSMYVTGPKVIKLVTGETVDAQALGGAMTHNQTSGVASFAMANEEGCFHFVKKLLRYLPSNNLQDPPHIFSEDKPQRICESLRDIVPEDASKPYEMKEVIEQIVDRDSFFGMARYYAKNAIIGLARLNGDPVGIIANQPKVLAGCLDIDSSDKIARFVRFCDAFNIPLVNLVDVPGYLPGIEQEHGGIIRHGAKVLYAYAEAAVPKISIILRKAFGGAYIAMASKQLGYDLVMAWPTAQIAVMGAEQGVNIIHHKELKVSKSPATLRKRKIAQYTKQFLNPYQPAQNGQVDQVIDPADTRKILIQNLQALKGKRRVSIAKRHGNIPL